MNRRTLLLIILLILVIALLVAVSQALKPQKEVTKTLPPVTVSPTPLPRNFTTLVASPSAGQVLIGEETSFLVLIDTAGNNVASAQLEMVFNPDYFSVTKIEPLTFFKDPTVLLKEIDNKTGSISYALGTTEVASGKGELVRITVLGKKSTANNSTPLTFLPKTSVGEIGNPASVLKQALGINLIIMQ